MSRPLAALLLTLTAALALPAAASASSRQISILQDDAVLLGLTPHDPDQAMAEAKYLGVDVVRVFLPWQRVSPNPRTRTRPAGFDVGDPDSPGYDWHLYDGLVDRARSHGLKVIVTLGPPIPYWASEEPRRCPHFVGGYHNLGKSCMWKPDARLFGQFVKAVARRYGTDAPGLHGGRVRYYSMWNEPNLEHYLYPQFKRTRYGTVDLGARYYRNLWYQGWKAIAAYDPAMRNRVLFGETSAISSPLDTIYGALCLDENGRPYRGKLRQLQGCSHPRKLQVGGFAVHPYNKDATGSVFSRSHTRDSLPMAYVGRLHRVIARAAGYGRVPPGRGIYLTEFGFQSNPPDRKFGLGLSRHAEAINQAERLFFADPLVRAISQFEIYDVPELPHQDVYNTGLRTRSGNLKPAYGAFRLPLVVTKLSANLVEVWGQVRPAEGSVRPTIVASQSAGESYAPIARPATNEAGYFRIRIRRPRAAKLRYRVAWTSPVGGLVRSRVARAGKPIHYLPDPKPRQR